MNTKTYKKDSELSLISLSIPFLFTALTGFAASIINRMALALVPNNGVIYSEAVGSASIITNVFITICSFVVGGIGIVISHRLGRNDDTKEIHKSIYTSLCISFIFSLCIFFLSELITPFVLFGFLSVGTQQYNNGLIYGELMSSLIVFFTMESAIGAIVNSYGYIKHTIIWNIMAIIIDVVLTLIFVLVFDMGVVGSALGTIIANFIVIIYAIIIFNKKVTTFSFKEFRITKRILKEIFKISIPIGFEKLSYNFAMLVIGIIVAQIGQKFSSFYIVSTSNSDGTSAINLLNLSNTIIQTFANLTFLVSIAFRQGSSIIAARKMGVKNFKEVSLIVRKSFMISLISDCLIAIMLFFVQSYLIDFFMISQSEKVKEYTPIIKSICFTPFLLLIFLEVGRTMNIIYLVGPMAYGNLIINSIFSVINTWSIILIFGLIAIFFTSENNGDFLFGINGIYILLMLDEIFRGIFNLWWWKSNKWQKYPKKKIAKQE